MIDPSTPRDGISLTTKLFLAASVVANAGLGAAVLTRSYDTGNVSVAVTAPKDRIPQIEGTGIDGRPVRIAFPDSRPTLVYVMSPECGWCRRNEANFAELVRTQASKYRVVVASVLGRGFGPYYDKVRPAWSGSEALPIVLSGSRTVTIAGTPTLLALSRDGMVEAVWAGAFDGSQKEVEDFFGVRLPGVSK